MTFITARDLRLKPTDLWKKLKKEDVIVVTLNGRPCAMISNVNSDTVEESLLLWKKVKAELAVSKLRQESVAKRLDKLALADVNKEILSVRHNRKK